MVELLVVGTGRSGTLSMSTMLLSAGINCCHEKIFKPHILINNLKNNQFEKFDLTKYNEFNYCGESSWLAVPFLEHDLCKNAKIIHLMRNPWHIYKSLISNMVFGQFLDGILIHKEILKLIKPEAEKFNIINYSKFASDMGIDFKEDWHRDRAIVYNKYKKTLYDISAYYIVEWHKEILKYKDSDRYITMFKIDKDNPIDLIQELGRDARYINNTRYHHYADIDETLRIEDISKEYREPLIDLCKQFGYDI